MKRRGILLCTMLLFFGFSFAHQPRIVFDASHTQENPILVTNPEISQAFYGNLHGQADVYHIQMTSGFLLYVNIVVPELSGQRTDFIVDIIKGNDAVYTRMDGTRAKRTPFYEEFAGDNYLKGPEREQEVSAGEYTIKVSNPDNQGKYSLAIGKIESFPPNEILKTFHALPILKTEFFNKPRWTISQGVI